MLWPKVGHNFCHRIFVPAPTPPTLFALYSNIWTEKGSDGSPHIKARTEYIETSTHFVHIIRNPAGGSGGGGAERETSESGAPNLKIKNVVP